MIVDEVIWEIINNQHCSFKSKIETNTFCKNEYNVTGLCNRNSCPLANSRYATVVEEKGACYLVMKTIERAHTPKDLWERIKLDKSYNTALEQIDEQLKYWPEFLKHKCKQRFTRYRQILVKKRKLKLKDTEVYEVVSRKAEKREKSRGKKAVKAAMIEENAAEAILENLKEGKYNEIYNIDNKKFIEVLNEKGTVEKEYDMFDYDMADEDKYILSNLKEDNFDYDDDDDIEEDEGDDDDFNTTNDFSSSNKTAGSKGKFTKKKRKINLEYEEDQEEKDVVYN